MFGFVPGVFGVWACIGGRQPPETRTRPGVSWDASELLERGLVVPIFSRVGPLEKNVWFFHVY